MKITNPQYILIFLLYVVFAALMFTVLPFIIIWAINVLLISVKICAIPYTLKTWFAVLIIISIARAPYTYKKQ